MVQRSTKENCICFHKVHLTGKNGVSGTSYYNNWRVGSRKSVYMLDNIDVESKTDDWKLSTKEFGFVGK